MKIQYVLEVFIITLFLVIPSLFQSYSGEPLTVGPYGWDRIVVYAAVSVFLYFRGRWYVNRTKNVFGSPSLFAGILLFAALCINSAFWNILQFISAQTEQVEFFFGNSKVLFFINALFGIAVFAFFEEVLYRFFLPEALRFISPKTGIISELVVILLFALGHRYMGVFAVLNAACAGFLLRFCMIKTSSVMLCSIVHAAYNAVQYAYLMIIGF